MTTSAHRGEVSNTDRTDPRRVRAWRVYRESIRDLEGEEYEAAERLAWDRLQRMRAELERHLDVRA